jgi:hypothetical protein
VFDADVLDPDVMDVEDAELEPPDHDAFQLDHRIVSPEPVSPEPVSPELSQGLMNRQAWRELAPSRLVAPSPPAPRAALILPPPPGPRELELPNADPFAGFIAPPPSVAQRCATVLVIALAVVGVFALAMLALG